MDTWQAVVASVVVTLFGGGGVLGLIVKTKLDTYKAKLESEIALVKAQNEAKLAEKAAEHKAEIERLQHRAVEKKQDSQFEIDLGKFDLEKDKQAWAWMEKNLDTIDKNYKLLDSNYKLLSAKEELCQKRVVYLEQQDRVKGEHIEFLFKRQTDLINAITEYKDVPNDPGMVERLVELQRRPFVTPSIRRTDPPPQIETIGAGGGGLGSAAEIPGEHTQET